jgi:hypothetical protein
MAVYAFAVPILAGQEEADRRFFAELQGPRQQEYETTWRRLGVRADRIWHQVTPDGTMAVVYLEADDMDRFFAEVATGTDPFLVWFRSQILAIHGLDLTQPLPGPPNTLLHDWSAA